MVYPVNYSYVLHMERISVVLVLWLTYVAMYVCSYLAGLEITLHHKINAPINIFPHYPLSGTGGAIMGDLTANFCPTLGHLTYLF